MKIFAWVFALLLTANMANNTASADRLLLEAIQAEPPNAPEGLERPHRGDNMSQVEAQFGKPQSSQGPLGQPPISRWDYPGFSVFFEYDLVLRSLVHQDNAQ